MRRDDDQERWPAGTPVAPGGRGPGGGRFRDAASTLAAGDLGAFLGGGADWAAKLLGRVTGDAYSPGEWRVVDPVEHMEDRRARLTRAFLDDGMSAREAAQIADQMMTDTMPPRSVYANGPHEVIFETDMDVPEQQILAFLDRLLAVDPRGVRKVRALRLSITPDLPRATGGLTLRDEGEGVYDRPVVIVTESVFRGPEHVRATLPARKMPASKAAAAWQYIMAHEWGHVLASGGEYGASMIYVRHLRDLSEYAETNGAEHTGEAFAEWFLSDGTSRNPAVVAYAELYGWVWPG